MPIQAIADNYPTLGWLLYGLSALMSTEISDTVSSIAHIVDLDPISSTKTILSYTFEEVHQITASIAMICLAFKFLSNGISKLLHEFRKDRQQEFEQRSGKDRRK